MLHFKFSMLTAIVITQLAALSWMQCRAAGSGSGSHTSSGHPPANHHPVPHTPQAPEHNHADSGWSSTTHQLKHAGSGGGGSGGSGGHAITATHRTKPASTNIPTAAVSRSSHISSTSSTSAPSTSPPAAPSTSSPAAPSTSPPAAPSTSPPAAPSTSPVAAPSTSPSAASPTSRPASPSSSPAASGPASADASSVQRQTVSQVPVTSHTELPGPTIAAKPCNCQGSQYSGCDTRTGTCMCAETLAGSNCDQCADGHFGYDAATSRCRPCVCSSMGTASAGCHESTGQCHCAAGFNGTRCNSCIDVSLTYSPSVGCQGKAGSPEGNNGATTTIVAGTAIPAVLVVAVLCFVVYAKQRRAVKERSDWLQSSSSTASGTGNAVPPHNTRTSTASIDTMINLNRPVSVSDNRSGSATGRYQIDRPRSMSDVFRYNNVPENQAAVVMPNDYAFTKYRNHGYVIDVNSTYEDVLPSSGTQSGGPIPGTYESGLNFAQNLADTLTNTEHYLSTADPYRRSASICSAPHLAAPRYSMSGDDQTYDVYNIVSNTRANSQSSCNMRRHSSQARPTSLVAPPSNLCLDIDSVYDALDSGSELKTGDNWEDSQTTL